MKKFIIKFRQQNLPDHHTNNPIMETTIRAAHKEAAKKILEKEFGHCSIAFILETN